MGPRSLSLSDRDLAEVPPQEKVRLVSLLMALHFGA